jgi:lipoprotein-anchoring transpeptidase ErfK/SrfK
MNRRIFLMGLAGIALTTSDAFAAKRKRRPYEGAVWVDFETPERPGTIIINSEERALYHVQYYGEAIRYGVAVGKESFVWSGVAKVGRKAEYPTWTPPRSMIRRKPHLAKWANGMPGGIPENPLGTRAIYLYAGGRDTLFRIHGTNEPGSIGTAASSGCIRMLNEEVENLYDAVSIGTKVIVL